MAFLTGALRHWVGPVVHLKVDGSGRRVFHITIADGEHEGGVWGAIAGLVASAVEFRGIVVEGFVGLALDPGAFEQVGVGLVTAVRSFEDKRVRPFARSFYLGAEQDALGIMELLAGAAIG